MAYLCTCPESYVHEVRKGKGIFTRVESLFTEVLDTIRSVCRVYQ